MLVLIPVPGVSKGKPQLPILKSLVKPPFEQEASIRIKAVRELKIDFFMIFCF
jgi:hypothetical protein